LRAVLVTLSGIFNSDDDKEDVAASRADEHDEVLTELKKKQAELRALSHQNAIMLRHLHKQAKQELQSQELKKRMAAADAEVSGRDSRTVVLNLGSRDPLGVPNANLGGSQMQIWNIKFPPIFLTRTRYELLLCTHYAPYPI